MSIDSWEVTTKKTRGKRKSPGWRLALLGLRLIEALLRAVVTTLTVILREPVVRLLLALLAAAVLLRTLGLSG